MGSEMCIRDSVGSLIVRTVLRARIPASSPSYAMHRWRRAALPFFVLAIADIVMGQIGVILVQAMGSSADAGLFAVALRGSAVVALCFVGVAAAIGPSAARHWASGDPAGLLRLVRRMALFSVAFAAPTAAFIAIFASPLMRIFGAEFTPASNALRLLCLGQLVFATFGVFGTVLLMTGEEALAARIMVGGLVVGVTLNVALIPHYGVNGSAVATTLALIACYGAMPIGLWRRWPQIRQASGSLVRE